MEMVAGKVGADIVSMMVGVVMVEELEDVEEEDGVIVDVEEAMVVGRFNKSLVVTTTTAVQVQHLLQAAVSYYSRSLSKILVVE